MFLVLNLVTIGMLAWLAGSLFSNTYKSKKSEVRKTLESIGLFTLYLWALWIGLRAQSEESFRLYVGFWAIAIGCILVYLVYLGGLSFYKKMKAEREAKKSDDKK